jgi:hypothetical protein
LSSGFGAMSPPPHPRSAGASQGSRGGDTRPLFYGDEDFSAEELRILGEGLAGEYEGMWDRLAAQFYQKTGRRVAPKELREKLGGLRGREKK